MRVSSFKFSVFSLVLLLLAGCEPAFARDYEATIVRVLDGDTVECRIELGFHLTLTEPVRMVGIDAPELPTVPGLASQSALQDLLPPGAAVLLRTGKRERDKYGRALGEVLKDGNSLNQQMLRRGLAKEMKP